MNTLQAGRAFAALAVLLFHVQITLALPAYLGRSIFPVFLSGYSGVHFFFVLSGFVIMLAHGRDFGRPERLGTFAWKRFRRIYPPLWVALLLVLPLILFLPGVNREAAVSLPDVLAAFTLLPARDEPVLSVAWTLRHEVLFYAVFGLAIWNARVGLTVAALWLALSATLPWLGLDYPLVFFFTSQHLLFAFGAVAFKLFERRLAPRPGVMLAAGLILFAVTWSIPLLKLPLHGIVGNWGFGLGAALAILGAAMLERERGLRTPRILIFLGEASYSIYLFHFPAVSGMAKAITLIGDRVVLPPQVWFALTAFVALAVGVAFHLLVEKPVLRLLARPRAADSEPRAALP